MNPYRTFLPYFKTHRKKLFIALLAGIVTGVASGSMIPVFIQKVFKTVFVNTEDVYSFEYILGMALLLPGAFVVRGVFGYINQYLMSFCGISILNNIRQNLFDKLQSVSVGFFEKNHSGDLLSRLMTDTTQIQSATMQFANEGLKAPFTALAGIGTLIYYSCKQKEAAYIIVLIAITPLMLYPVKLIGRHLKHRSRQVQKTLGEVTEHLSENFHANVEVRTFNLQQNQSSKFSTILMKHISFFMKQVKYEKLTQPLMEIIAAMLVAFTFVYAKQTKVDFDTFAAIAGAIYFAVDAIKRFMKAVNEMQKAQGAIERVNDILSIKPNITSPENPVKMEKVDGNIRFENVDFAYDETPTLKHVTTEIPAGMSCALVGPSGAGKSTFIKLVSRFYDTNSGSILIDGTEIKNMSLFDLRQHVAVVPQQPILFNDTVANNIRLGRKDATEEEIIAAAKSAQAYDFIQSFDDGFDTIVGEDATRLSGGQKQRIALARAFLKNAPILILDEATSALDSESEAKIQLALDELIKGKTVLIVAHRFSTIKKCERILVFEAGELVDQGSHEELMTHSPLYKQLYERQV